MSETTNTQATTKVAVYGTLRQGWGNHRLISSQPSIRYVGKGRTKNKYALRHSTMGIPFVNQHVEGVSEDKLANVLVEVYEVPNGRELDRLDGLEGHPDWYYREVPIEIEMEDGTTETAEIYFNEDGRSLPYNPTGDYAKKDNLVQ